MTTTPNLTDEQMLILSRAAAAWHVHVYFFESVVGHNHNVSVVVGTGDRAKRHERPSFAEALSAISTEGWLLRA